MKQALMLRVNGRSHEILAEPSRTLLQVLREDLDLTGTKEVCQLGACGACTVLVDGKPSLSCLTLAIACRNKEVTTIEGMKIAGELHPLQQAFIDTGAVQCGYCTPGLVLSGAMLLKEQPNPTSADIQQALAGNLCRCTGYAKVIAAIQKASEMVD